MFESDKITPCGSLFHVSDLPFWGHFSDFYTARTATLQQWKKRGDSQLACSFGEILVSILPELTDFEINEFQNSNLSNSPLADLVKDCDLIRILSTDSVGLKDVEDVKAEASEATEVAEVAEGLKAFFFFCHQAASTELNALARLLNCELVRRALGKEADASASKVCEQQQLPAIQENAQEASQDKSGLAELPEITTSRLNEALQRACPHMTWKMDYEKQGEDHCPRWKAIVKAEAGQTSHTAKTKTEAGVEAKALWLKEFQPQRYQMLLQEIQRHCK